MYKSLGYEEAKKVKQGLDKRCDDIGKLFKQFRTNSMGLVEDDVRKTKEYKKIDAEYTKAFNELREFNSWYVKKFKKEIQEDRKNKYKKR